MDTLAARHVITEVTENGHVFLQICPAAKIKS
jgi:hypothetical protein